MSAIKETIKETTKKTTKETTTNDGNKVTIKETIKETTKETKSNDSENEKPLPDPPTLGQQTASALAPAQSTHVYLLHRRDHNSLNDEKLPMENPNPTRVFYDRDHAIGAARQLWEVSDYNLICGQPNQILTVHDEDGNERNGRILLLCDDPEGREKEAQAKIWVERCAVEDAGVVRDREAERERAREMVEEQGPGIAGKAKMVRT